MDHLPQPSGFGQPEPDPSLHHRKPGQGQGRALRNRLIFFLPSSSFLGCSDNELIHCFFQGNGKRTFCTRAWMPFPLSASEESRSDNQKTTHQPASSWQDEMAHLTPSRRAQTKHRLSLCGLELLLFSSSYRDDCRLRLPVTC